MPTVYDIWGYPTLQGGWGHHLRRFYDAGSARSAMEELAKSGPWAMVILSENQTAIAWLMRPY
jgi:hypothetical protein